MNSLVTVFVVYKNPVHYQIQIVISLCTSSCIVIKVRKKLMILKIVSSLGTDWYYFQCLPEVHSEIYQRLNLREKIEKKIITQNVFKWHEQQIDAYWEKSWYVTTVHCTCSFCGFTQNVYFLVCRQVDYSWVFF